MSVSVVFSCKWCHGVPRTFCAENLPPLAAWLDKNKINYYLKKELKSCLFNLRRPSFFLLEVSIAAYSLRRFQMFDGH
jgi:hypothetical protein